MSDGYINSLQELVYLAQAATSMLEKLSKTAPKFVAVLAKHYTTWPVVVRRTTARASPHRDLFRTISLGADKRFASIAKEMGEDTGAKSYAVHLLETLEYCRWLNSTGRECRHEIEVDGYSQYPEVFDLAIALPPLSATVATQWWKVANVLLHRLTSGSPSESVLLVRYTKTKRAGALPNEKGVRDQDAKKQVRQAFINIVKLACRNG